MFSGDPHVGNSIAPLIAREGTGMPARYVVGPDGRLVFERWSGSVTLAELRAHKARLVADPSIRAGASILSDARGATFPFSPEAAAELAEPEPGLPAERKIARFALVVDGPMHASAREFASLVGQHGMNAIVFNSMEVASAWLGIDARTLQALVQRVANDAV
jgi:hypothetical protein